jgi:hypothetical protein
VSYVYLASPYSHPDPLVRESRYAAAKHAVKFLLGRKIWVYSPIVHCHVLAGEEKLPFDFSAWEAYNYAMLEHASKLFILRIDGTDQSKGVAAEIVEAARLGISYEYL